MKDIRSHQLSMGSIRFEDLIVTITKLPTAPFN